MEIEAQTTEPPPTAASYKSQLTGIIPGAYQSAFFLDKGMNEKQISLIQLKMPFDWKWRYCSNPLLFLQNPLLLIQLLAFMAFDRVQVSFFRLGPLLDYSVLTKALTI